ncbi:ubiquinone anaerobic biosynthesis accessory factor UbiT [Roseibium sp.]|uniref:ubiquinone anaerobic biosynthesis accessory factor UbiT n=1 Tax=Roseibium sp. TaxID=1936156 RepID=UPI003A978B5D
MPEKSSLNGHLPPFLSALARPLPRRPMEILLARLIDGVLKRRPSLVTRLGATASVPIAVVPDDLPHAFLLTLSDPAPDVRIVEKDDIAEAKATIRGPLLTLLGLLDGTYDGDAVFFSRSLRIEGRTDHVLALRNTLEEADLTPAEFVGLSGKPAELANSFAGAALSTARRLTGATPQPKSVREDMFDVH